MSLIEEICNDNILESSQSNFNSMIAKRQYVSIDDHHKKILGKLLQNCIIIDITTIVHEFMIPEIIWIHKKDNENFDIIKGRIEPEPRVLKIVLRMESVINGKLNGVVKGFAIDDKPDNSSEIIEGKKYKIKYTTYYLNDKLHRTDGPAVIDRGDRRIYYQNGKLHRTDGPAFISYNKLWYRNDKLHRDNGPSSYYGFNEKWFVNGKPHREDGPAVKRNNDQRYYQYGLTHRIGGPAMIDKNICI